MRQSLAWQPSLLDSGLLDSGLLDSGLLDSGLLDAGRHGSGPLGSGVVGPDPILRRRHRRELAGGAWIDVVPAWCAGADELFARLLVETPWGPQRTVRMYDRVVPEPRLTHRWTLDSAPAELADMARLLGSRYDVEFTQVGANLYRDGADSVAWHGDRVARELPEAVVALVSLGAVRPFRLRPSGGGASIGLLPGPGDLLVMGGSCQRTWQHSVPKTRAAGPRISVQFRHAYDR